MNKIISGLIFALTFVNGSWAGDMPEKIVVMGQDLYLKYQEGNAKKGFIAEYIPQTETLDNWKLMFAVRFTPDKNGDLTSIGQDFMDEIAKKKKEGDVLANGRVIRNAEKSFLAVDFLVSSLGTPVKELFFEHNVFVYFKVPKGIVSYQIARRAYKKVDSDDVMMKFVTDIPIFSNQMLTELSSPPTKPPFNVE